MKKHELAKVSSNHPRVILDWTQRGYLVPAEKAEGQGKISYYNAENVVQARILKKLPKSLDPFTGGFNRRFQNFGYRES